MLLAALVPVVGLGVGGRVARGQTSFGSVALGSSKSAAATVTIPAMGSFSSISVVTGGAPNLDFTSVAGGTCVVGSTYTAGATCTVEVNFTPKYPGVRYGAVVLTNATGVVATAYLQGTGSGTPVTFSPGAQTLISGSFLNATGLAVDGLGNVYVADQGSITNYTTNVGTGGLFKETLLGVVYTQSEIASGLNATGVAVDGAGNVYVTDVSAGSGKGALIKETLFNGAYVKSTIATGFNDPVGVAVTGAGNVYVTDAGNGLINSAGMYEEALVNGSYTQSELAYGVVSDYGVALDGSGNDYFIASPVAGQSDVYKSPLPSFYQQGNVGSGYASPRSLAVDGNGAVYIADTGYGGQVPASATIYKETPSGSSYTRTTLGTGLIPVAVAVDGRGVVYAAGGVLLGGANGGLVGQSLYKLDVVDTPTATTLTTSASPVAAGTAVTFTATVKTATASMTVPAGNVAFSVDGTVAATVALNPAGVAAWTSSTLAAGMHTVLANYQGSATLAASNASVTETVNGPAATPVFTPAAGTYYAVTPVTIADATAGSTIYYTTNGIAPTVTTGTKYVSGTPISVGASETLQAIAVAPLYLQSATATAAYTIHLLATPTSVFPSIANAGGPAFTLTVNGDNFLAGTVVEWGSTALSTTFVSATQLTAAVPASLIATAGTVQIGLTTSAGLSLTLPFTVRVPQLGATISTVAGWNSQATNTGCSGSTDTYNDGCAAAEAVLSQPAGSVLDASGNLYIADSGSCTVRVVNAATGIISVYAGTPRAQGATGLCADSGDGGPATKAGLDPAALAFDSAGNLYIADYNNRIRMVTPAGTISTFAGTGVAGYLGDGGPAASARFNGPQGLAFDAAGNLYVADFNNQRIRVITPGGTKISTFAGTGVRGATGDGGPALSATFNYPAAVAVDGAGSVYVADEYNSKIRKITAAGMVSTFAGTGSFSWSGDGGPAAKASLSQPTGVAVDQAGNVYIADQGNARVRVVNFAGTISTVAGNGQNQDTGDRGPAAAAQLYDPTGVNVDSAGNLYLTEEGYLVRKITFTPSFTAPYITSLAPASATFGAGSFTLTVNGENFVPGAVVTWSYPATVPGPTLPGPSGGVATTITVFVSTPLATTYVNSGQLTAVVPAAVTALGLYGNGLYLNASVTVTAPTGISAVATLPVNSPAENISSLSPQFATAGGAAFTLTVNGGGFNTTPTTVMWGSTALATTIVNGSTLTATVPASLIATAGTVQISATSSAGVSNLLPYSVVAASALSPGTISTYAGSASNGYSGDGSAATSAKLSYAQGSVMDGAGNLYFVDQNGLVVRKVTASGTISTIAGIDNQSGSSGDGGPATSAKLNGANWLALDSLGNLYIADAGNYRVRKVTPAGIISTVFGGGATACPPGQATDSLGDGCPATSGFNGAISGIAFDSANNLYVASSQQEVGYTWCAVTKVNSGGILSLYAGSVRSPATGAGGCGYSGDGGAATAAQMWVPGGIAFDASGNLYIADTQNLRVRKVTPAGIISTYAGSGIPFWSNATWSYPYFTNYGAELYAGDGGAATNAVIGEPSGLAVDASGNLFIQDESSYVVRKVTPAGIITTVAGNGTNGYSGDGGPATLAQLGPAGAGIATDPVGNLYISDGQNNRVRKVRFASAKAQVATPVFSPAAGAYTSTAPIAVTITSTAGATIYYTIGGTTPTTASTKYTGPVSVGTTETINAIAVLAGDVNSYVGSATYTVTIQVATPVFSVAPGIYPAGQLVTLTDATAGAAIYYTTDGSVPSAASKLYAGPILVGASETLQAIAILSGEANSAVASAAYTIIGSPAALALPASSLTTTSATLNATVNPLGLAGSYSFSWGTSATSLSASTPATPLAAVSGNVAAAAALSGLTTKTTYYYRVTVTTTGGTTSGAILSFTTN